VSRANLCTPYGRPPGEAPQEHRAAGYPVGVTLCLGNLGTAALLQHRYDDAFSFLAENVRMSEELGFKYNVG
jgi:hypothetical protein